MNTAKVIDINTFNLINGTKPEHPFAKKGKAGVRKTMTPFTSDEISNLINRGLEWVEESPSKAKLNYRSQTLLAFIVGINVGLRASDLITLQWRDFYFDESSFNDVVQIVEQKTGKRKNFPLNAATRNALEWYRHICNADVCSNDWVFKSRQREKDGSYSHITLDTLSKRLKDLTKECGVNRKVATHNLRKTFATQQFMAHNDNATFLYDLSKLLNHGGDIRVTMRYACIDTEEIKSLYDDVCLGF